MFESLQLRHIDLGQDYIDENDVRKDTVRKGFPELDPGIAAISNTSFRLAGEGQIMVPPPVTEEDKLHYAHIISFGYMGNPVGYYTRRSNNNSFLLLYTHSGRGRLAYEGKNYELQEGDLFFVDCRIPHLYETVSGVWEHSDLHIGGSLVAQLYKEFAVGDNPVLGKPATSDYIKHLTKLLETASVISPLRSMRINCAIDKLLTGIVEASQCSRSTPPASEPELQRLIAYFRNHLNEDISLDGMAEIAGISKYHLVREFGRMTGYPPNEYFIRLRLEEACFLLTSTPLPVGDIGERTGFANQQYFSRIFKKRMGVTPMQYRHSGGM